MICLIFLKGGSACVQSNVVEGGYDPVKNGIDRRCLIAYSVFPDYDTLSNDCYKEMGVETDKDEEDLNSSESIETEGDDILSSDQAYRDVVNYCIAKDPSLDGIMEDGKYPTYWNIGDLEGDTYTVHFRSYTAAHIYIIM